MNFKTISAILRHDWLINPEYAQQHIALAIRMAKGETVDFGIQGADKAPEPVILQQLDPCMGAAIVGVGPGTNLPRIQPGSIAQVDIVGPVLKYGDACSYGMTDTTALITTLQIMAMSQPSF
jgi:hypothetical protein